MILASSVKVKINVIGTTMRMESIALSYTAVLLQSRKIVFVSVGNVINFSPA